MSEVITMPDGSRGIVCRGHQRKGRMLMCGSCGAGALFVCDGPAIYAKTCDKPMCSRHATTITTAVGVRHLCFGCAERRRMVLGK